MNMPANIKHTAAEEAILSALADSSREQAKTAIERITRTGLPTRRVEAWHYTDLRSLLKEFPGSPSAIQSEFYREDIGDLPDLVDSAVIGFSNVFHVEGMVENLPAGISASVDVPTAEPLEGVRIDDNTIGILNSGLTEAGITMSVDAGASVEMPVTIAHACSGQTASALTHSVNVGEGASATFIERHYSSSIPNHQNIVCNLTVEKGAKAVWVIVQELGWQTDRLAQLNVSLAEESDLTILVLNAGGRLVRQEIHLAVEGENANLAIKGVNLIGEGAHIDVTTTLDHKVPNTTATELFRNVVVAKGKGAFQGQIRVAQQAQKTDAQMACNTLLLSDDSDFSAKPELEIFADDVVCAHGATVADIEEDHLFYLRARGIPEREARALLVKAFVEEVFEELDNEALGEALVGRIEEWLDNNG